MKLSPTLWEPTKISSCPGFYAKKKSPSLKGHPEGAPYLVLLRSPGPLSAPTAPGGNIPALRDSGEGVDLQPAPSLRPEAGRVVPGGLIGGAAAPWPRALVCHQVETGARL